MAGRQSKNPYAIVGAKRGIAKSKPDDPPPKDEEALAGRDWTEADQQEALSGYMAIERKHWSCIRYGTHIRYKYRLQSDPDQIRFSGGGFVRENPWIIEHNPDEERKYCMRINSQRFGNPQSSWTIAYDRLVNVYVCAGADIVHMHGMLADLASQINGQFTALNSRLNALDEKIKRLERR